MTWHLLAASLLTFSGEVEHGTQHIMVLNY